MSVWIISLNLCSNWHWHKLHLVLVWPGLFWAVISSTRFPENYICIYFSVIFKASGILWPISAKANGRNFKDILHQLILWKKVTTTDQRPYYCAHKGKAAVWALYYIAEYICDHESQTYRKSNFYFVWCVCTMVQNQ